MDFVDLIKSIPGEIAGTAVMILIVIYSVKLLMDIVQKFVDRKKNNVQSQCSSHELINFTSKQNREVLKEHGDSIENLRIADEKLKAQIERTDARVKKLEAHWSKIENNLNNINKVVSEIYEKLDNGKN